MLGLKTRISDLHLHRIKGISPTVAQKLGLALAEGQVQGGTGEATLEDLLHHLPIRYEDRSRFAKVSELANGMAASIEATVRVAASYFVGRRRLRIFEISATDETGQVRAYWWNQPWREKTLKPGTRIILYGTWRWNSHKRCFEVQGGEPEVTSGDEEADAPIHTGRRVPVYRKLGSFKTRWLRSILYHTLKRLPPDSVEEYLPVEVRRRHRLVSQYEAFCRSHFPGDEADLAEFNTWRSAPQRRLIFEEFFWMQMALAARRQDRELSPKGPRFEVNDRLREIARSVMPFPLTRDQREALRQIVANMTSTAPMHRLLQGDVGSGKTIVALLAGVVAIENGYQAALMAPTEILAEQHARNIKRLLAQTPYRVELLIGGLRSKAKAGMIEDIAAGEVDLIIGTHALIQHGVQFHKLGFVIIDEQHRFGVMQRAELIRRGLYPDVLVMTATPIPRSLAMTLYGDLDISTIREMPPGRTPIHTALRFDDSRDKVYRFIQDQIRTGRQAYIVYPLVEGSEKLDLRDASQAAESLRQHVFPKYEVGLLHGRLKADEKDEIMRRFASGAINVLVSTTVIEVGVDVPNASVMLIEHAERFGLAQLHQLRGRVGRGTTKSYCILMSERGLSDEARIRLEILAKSSDGFVIAEKDLELRGPGELLGTRQSGIPVLRIANLVRDQELLELARQEVERMCMGRWKSPEVKRLIQVIQSHPRYGLASVG